MASLQEAVTRADEGERTHEFTRLTIVNQKVLVLGAEAENCIGEDLSFVGATRSRRRDRPEHSPYDPTQPPAPGIDIERPGEASPHDGLSVGPRNRPRAAQPHSLREIPSLHEPTPRTVDRPLVPRSLAARARAGAQGSHNRLPGPAVQGERREQHRHPGQRRRAAPRRRRRRGRLRHERLLLRTSTAIGVAADPHESCFGELSNATRTGAAGRHRRSTSRAGLMYRRYQSDDADVQNVQATRGCRRPGFALSTGGGQFGFGLADTFARLEDPPYNRSRASRFRSPAYNNQASAEGRWAPGGGRLTATLATRTWSTSSRATYDYASTDATT